MGGQERAAQRRLRSGRPQSWSCLLGQKLKGQHEVWNGLPGVRAEGWQGQSHRRCPMSRPPRITDLLPPGGTGHGWGASSHTLFPSPGPLPVEAVSACPLSLAPTPAGLGQGPPRGSPCPQASWRLSTSPPGGSLIGTPLSPADNEDFVILFTACIPASGTGLVNSKCSLCVCGRHLCWRNIESKGAAR